MVDVELHPHGITYFKKLSNHIVCIKLNFFLQFSFHYIIGIKTTPGDHEPNCKKVGAILYGCNNNGT